MNPIYVLFMSVVMLAACFSPVSAIEAGNVDIHGFISQGYLLTDDNNYMADTEDGTFQFNETGINISSSLTDTLHLSMQIFSRDMGDVGNNDVVLGYAYGDYRWQNWLGVRAGKIKIDYGLYNETREMDMFRTGVMLPQSIYTEIWRDSFSNINGLGLYGYVPGGVMGRFSYNFQIGAMEFKDDGGFAKYITPALDKNLNMTEIDSDYAWFADLQWHTPLKGLKTKSSYYRIEGMNVRGNIFYVIDDGMVMDFLVNFDLTRKDGYIFSLEYIWQNLVLVAEYSEDIYEFDLTIENDSLSPALKGEKESSETITSQGWYVSASYRFCNWFESALTYSEYYPDKDDKNGDYESPGQEFNAWLKTTTLSTRFDINEYWILKLEASYNDGFGGMNLAKNDKTDPYWWLFAAKVTFSF